MSSRIENVFTGKLKIYKYVALFSEIKRGNHNILRLVPVGFKHLVFIKISVIRRCTHVR